MPGAAGVRPATLWPANGYSATRRAPAAAPDPSPPPRPRAAPPADQSRTVRLPGHICEQLFRINRAASAMMEQVGAARGRIYRTLWCHACRLICCGSSSRPAATAAMVAPLPSPLPPLCPPLLETDDLPP